MVDINLPKMGRPLKGDMPKNVSLQLRISQDVADLLQETATIMNVSRTEVIEQGIKVVHESVVEKK